MTNKPKIFIGNVDVASQVSDLKRVFKEEFQIDSFTIHDHPSSVILKQHVDLDLFKEIESFKLFKPRRISTKLKKRRTERLRRKYLQKAIDDCDIFIFFWKTFFEDHSDLEIIKKAGKKIYFCFVGSDVRWYHGQKQEFESYHLKPLYPNGNIDLAELDKKLKFIRNAEKYADGIFSRLDQAQIQLRPYYRFHMQVRLSDYVVKEKSRSNKIKIGHAPTTRANKGTKYVLEAFDKLRQNGYDIEPVLIENMKHAEAIEMYNECDIIVDQLICPGSGKLATEALAMGKVVVGHMAYGVYPQNENLPDYPIIDANTETIYEVLKNLIEDDEFRSLHAKKSRPFVEQYLDYRHMCSRILSLANGDEIEFDYYPTFFRDKFVPELDSSTEIYNSYNELVSSCDWYKKHIRTGERNGLIF